MAELIVALDCEIEKAKEIVKRVSPFVNFFKVGPVLFVKNGKEILDFLSENNKKIFLDLKFHDIPNTVKKAIENLSSFNVYSVSVHISGGPNMLKAAREAVGNIKIWGVSILTSIDNHEYAKIGYRYSLQHQVLHFARMAKECGVDGVVSSPQELYYLKKKIDGIKFITPSIRLEKDEDSDQKRFLTPKQAVMLGSDYLVIGRPVISSEKPEVMIQKIFKEMEIK